MSKIKTKVFFDANVVIEAGKPPGGPLWHRVSDLMKAGLVEVLTTDITLTEVAKKHADNEFQIIKNVGRPHFRDLVKEHVGVKIPEINKAALRDQMLEKFRQSVSEMFESLKAKTLAVDEVKPSTVLDAYANNKGFFGGEGKRDQFPDAFIFECLRMEAAETRRVIIVSNDGDFAAPTKEAQNIALVQSIPDLFKELGLEVDAPDLDEFLDEQQNSVIELIGKELRGWQLQVADIADGEIEDAKVVSVEFPEFISFGPVKKGGSILVVGKVDITAEVSYTHPNWDEATYDSEDRLIAFDDVSGEREVTFEADFSMSVKVSDGGEPECIEEFELPNSDFVFIYLY